MSERERVAAELAAHRAAMSSYDPRFVSSETWHLLELGEAALALLASEGAGEPVAWALMEDGKPRHATLSEHARDAWIQGSGELDCVRDLVYRRPTEGERVEGWVPEWIHDGRPPANPVEFYTERTPDHPSVQPPTRWTRAVLIVHKGGDENGDCIRHEGQSDVAVGESIESVDLAAAEGQATAKADGPGTPSRGAQEGLNSPSAGSPTTAPCWCHPETGYECVSCERERREATTAPESEVEQAEGSATERGGSRPSADPRASLEGATLAGPSVSDETLGWSRALRHQHERAEAAEAEVARLRDALDKIGVVARYAPPFDLQTPEEAMQDIGDIARDALASKEADRED